MFAAIEKIKDVAAALGVGGVLWSAYSVSGLPIPATLAQVEERIESINATIRGMKIDLLTGQRATITLTRVSLRNERTALDSALDKLEPSARSTVERRLGEIDDQLRELEQTDAALRTRINGLQPK